MPSCIMSWQKSGATWISDAGVSAVIITGAGKAFSGGGDLILVKEMSENFEVLTRVWKKRATSSTPSSTARSRLCPPCTGPAVKAPAWLPASWRTFRSRRRRARILERVTRGSGSPPAINAALSLAAACAGLAEAEMTYLLTCDEPCAARRRSASGSMSLCVEEDQLQDKALEGRDPVGQRFADRDPLDQIRPEQLAADGGPNLRHLAGAGVHGLQRRGRARGASLATRETCAQLQEGLPALIFFLRAVEVFCSMSGRLWHIGPEGPHIDTRT